MHPLQTLLVLGLFLKVIYGQDQPSCSSKVFCQGQLLHTVQMSRIFNDSKTFVDLALRTTETEILKNFDILMQSTNNNPSKEQIRKFIGENFENVNEFEQWTPPDFKSEPKILTRIEDESVRNFTRQLVKIWLILARKIKTEVLVNPEKFTLIPVENGFIIPGGRFREFYYWDSYWIIKGLLLCEMHETVKGMLDNFLSLVRKYGFIPNGSRIYYLNRSQPPLLTAMVEAYVKTTNDTDWLKKNVEIIDEELTYWLKNKLTEVDKNGIKYILAHYSVQSGSPRPESYREDFNNANFYPDKENRSQLWSNLKAGAESGLDFSSRWIIDEIGDNAANISFLQTREIIPVDLNSFLCQAFRHLSEFYQRLNNYDRAIFWMEKSKIWQKTIKAVFYNEEDGIWYDWDALNSKPRQYFYPSNFAPLWAGAFEPLEGEILGKRAVDYFTADGTEEFHGGIPSSLINSGEQWDYPNAWPPHQSIVILGLEKTKNPRAKYLARELARRWIKANMIGFKQTDEMFEKYDAITPGKYGGGGEYVIQTGFGWTNGVVFELVNKYFTKCDN